MTSGLSWLHQRSRQLLPLRPLMPPAIKLQFRAPYTCSVRDTSAACLERLAEAHPCAQEPCHCGHVQVTSSSCDQVSKVSDPWSGMTAVPASGSKSKDGQAKRPPG